jgi:pimeloyl-ACP methyl ester carboxylesterase
MPFARIDYSLEMYYEDENFTDPWRNPETVVLHHGNAKNSRLWYAWVPLLARSYRVIRLDARGFGRSTVPPEGYRWSLSRFAADLLGLLDHLELGRVHLIGETVGGTISLQFASEYPERLLSVTTCTSPYKFVGVPTYRESYNLVRAEGVESWVRRTAERRLETGDSAAAHQEWYINQMAQTQARVVMETLDYLAEQDLTDAVSRIRTPALVLASEQNASENPDRTTGLASLLPNGRLKVIPGTSGYVQHSAPEQCVQAWRQFVNSL